MNHSFARTVNTTRWLSAGLAAILSPIPLLDDLVLAPVYGAMAIRIGRTHHLSIGEMPWKQAGPMIVAGLVGRAAANLTVSYIPGVAAVANAMTAIILTDFLAPRINDACEAAARRACNASEHAPVTAQAATSSGT